MQDWAAHAQPDFETDWPRIVAESVTAIERVCSEADYRSLVFVSKSAGTYIAGQAAKRLPDLPIRHLFLTPTPVSIPLLLEQGGAVVVGDRDRVFPAEHIAQLAGARNLAVTVLPGAQHDLEVNGDIAGSLQILDQIAAFSAELART